MENNTKYYYRVRATDNNGTVFSVDSNEVSAIPVLLPPTNLVAQPLDGEVRLSWTASPSRGELRYRILRTEQEPDSDPNAPDTRIWSSIDTSATTVLVDNSAVNNRLYFYVVQAFENSKKSVYSNEVSAMPVSKPPIPSNLAAVGGNRQVSLTWITDNTLPNRAISYHIERYDIVTSATSTSPAVYGYVNIGITETLSFVAKGLWNGTSYTFRVRGVNGSGAGIGAEKSATPRLPAPFLTGRPLNRAAEISWNAVENATSYTIRRRVGTNSVNPIIQQAYTSTSFTDVGAYNGGGTPANPQLTNGTNYTYTVQAVESNIDTSDSSNQILVTPRPPPNAPTNLTATAGSGEVSLSWAASTSAGTTGYNIRRSTISGSSYSLIGNTTTATTFIDASGLTNGATYYYVVSAVGVGESINSNQASATPFDGWRTSTPISSGGIRPLPIPAGQSTVAPGSTIRLSAFLAVDWDERSETVNGSTIARVFADPCTYSWGFNAGSVEDNIATGQSILWTAPAQPGTYTVSLSVNDQNGDNKSSLEGGGRNDDPALQFSINISVQ